MIDSAVCRFLLIAFTLSDPNILIYFGSLFGGQVRTSQVLYSGKSYNTVQIGTQCWLKENLDIGTRIDGTQEQTNNSTIEKYCYNNNPNNCNTYGGLYQWSEAMQYTTAEGARGICPNGWHVPSYTEFQTLYTTVGHDGNALRAIGQGSGAGAGTNTSGFSALNEGDRSDSSTFEGLGYSAVFWNSTEYSATDAIYLILHGDNSEIHLGIAIGKDYGFSIRCVKD
jgi:uncharacterized protein (TIGR02145 family)